MLSNVQAMILVGWRLCKLYESGKMTPGHASLGKVISNNLVYSIAEFEQTAIVSR
jgi:hypothetical protein